MKIDKHDCGWCRQDTPHKMSAIHKRSSTECCYCNPSLAIESIPEPYKSIAIILRDSRIDTDDCCYINLDSKMDDVIRMGIKAKNE